MTSQIAVPKPRSQEQKARHAAQNCAWWTNRSPEQKARRAARQQREGIST
jgi:hypothetical protein